MSDRRALKSNGRVAHVSLRGQVEAERFVEGEIRRVTRTTTPVLDRTGEWRERELLFGQGFHVLDVEGALAFGFCDRDGYVGHVATADLAAGLPAPTHRVVARLTYSKAAPDLKARNEVTHYIYGSELTVVSTSGSWAQITTVDGAEFVPAVHLAALQKKAADPVAVAELFLGVPYLWGGNSSLGIDCSGLVQAACLACGIPCPGDSDQQQDALGVTLGSDITLQRGDILFWKGHVAWVADEQRLLHANAHHMAVAYEPIGDAIARIKAQGDGDVTRRARLKGA